MKNELLNNKEKIHTTELGVIRIKRNLSLTTNDVVGWCKAQIQLPEANIESKGKNYYVHIHGHVITINKYSFTIITAHKDKK